MPSKQGVGGSNPPERATEEKIPSLKKISCSLGIGILPPLNLVCTRILLDELLIHLRVETEEE